MQSSAPSNLMHPRSLFVGREREYEALSELLQSYRLVTVVGPGGCGKTRLSTEWASRHLRVYAGGVWFVDLSSISDAYYIPEFVARTVGVRVSSAESPIEAIAERFEGLPVLLILDNCEHLQADVLALGQSLLTRAGNLKLLATSRRKFDTPEETVLELKPLSFPRPTRKLVGSEVRSYEAPVLLRERARSYKSNFEIDDENAYLVASICKKLDGLPLAIELAAVRVADLPLLELDRRLNQMMPLLTGGSKTRQPRQQTIRSLIDWSFVLLSEPERRLLAILSVFAGGWTAEAARVVFELTTGQSGRIDEWLGSLANQSLLTGGSGRYSMLTTVRQFAAEKLTEFGLAGAACMAHANWVRSLVDRCRPTLASGDYEACVPILDPEHENIRTALQWSLQDRSNLDLPIGIIGDLGKFWYQRGHGLEARQWIHRCLAGCPEGSCSSVLRMEALVGAIGLAGFEGDYATVRQYCGELADMATRHGNSWFLGIALHEDAKAAQFGRGDLELARTLYKKALDHYKKVPNSEREIYSISAGLGLLESALGNYEIGAANMLAALEAATTAGDKEWIAYSRLGLSSIYDDACWYEQADRVYEDVLSDSRRFGMKTLELNVLHPYSRMNLDRQMVEKGMAGYRQALELAAEINDRLRLAYARAGVARASAHLGDVVTATEFLSDWDNLPGQSVQPLKVERLFAASLLLLAKGKHDEALEVLACAIQEREKIKWVVPPAERRRWKLVEDAAGGTAEPTTDLEYEDAMRLALTS
jgi:predicted ATPase